MSLVADLRRALRGLWRSSSLRLSLLLSAVFALGMAGAILIALDLGRAAIVERVDSTLAAMASVSELDEDQERSASVIYRALDDLRGLPPEFREAAIEGTDTLYLERNFRGSDVWRAVITRDGEGERILIAVPMEDSLDALELLAGILWTVAGLLIFITLAIGVLAGLWAQRRVKRIDRTLRDLASGDLNARTRRARAVDDLDDIALQLDQTAGELERLVAQTRNLSASLAHDLRTPLARLRAQLEMLPEGEGRGAALEEVGRLSDIFDTIMRVARIEAAQGQDGFEPVDLAALVAELADIFGPVVEDEGKRLTTQTAQAKPVMADRQMLVQAMANLIQNALVYGGEEVCLFANGATLGVRDNGTGVDPAQFDEIIKPMVRLDSARASDGSGLGLALVRAVADRHSAKLHLAQNAPSGLQVSLNFAKL